jgi:hypothetical protein
MELTTRHPDFTILPTGRLYLLDMENNQRG